MYLFRPYLPGVSRLLIKNSVVFLLSMLELNMATPPLEAIFSIISALFSFIKGLLQPDKKAERKMLKLKHKEDAENPLTFSQESGMYYDANAERFCSGCYDSPEKQRIHLVPLHERIEHDEYQCPVCKMLYKDKNVINPRKPFITKSDWDVLADD